MSGSSRPSADPEPLADATASRVPGLDLPHAPDFVSRPPRLSLAVSVKLSEARLAQVNSRPEAAQQRLETKSRRCFVL